MKLQDQSILDTTKSLLGIESDYQAFDDELVLYINSAFVTLNQMGIGPKVPFSIKDRSAKWSDFLTDEDGYEWHLEMVKTYMSLKVRLTFDPPTSSYVAEEFNKQLTELEWRMYLFSDNKEYLKNQNE